MVVILEDPNETLVVECLVDIRSRQVTYFTKHTEYECLIIKDYKDGTGNISNALRIKTNDKKCSHIIAIRKDFDWILDDWFSKRFKIIE